MESISLSKEFLQKLLGNKSVTYRADFAKCFGGIQAGLFLSQLCYWADRGQSDWIYKTQKEWTDELGMTRCEQETARRKLKSHEVIKERFKGSPPKIHYKIDFGILIKKMQSYFQTCGNVTCSKPAGQLVENQQDNSSQFSKSSITENITENTAENTSTKNISNHVPVQGTKKETDKESSSSFVQKNKNNKVESKGQSKIEQMRPNVEEPHSRVSGDADFYDTELGEAYSKKKKPAAKKKTLNKVEPHILSAIKSVEKEYPRLVKFYSEKDIKFVEIIEKLVNFKIDPLSFVKWYVGVKGHEFRSWAYVTAPSFLSEYDLYKNGPMQVKKKILTDEERMKMAEDKLARRREASGR